MKAAKQTKAELSKQLEQAVFHIAYNIFWTTETLVSTRRSAQKYPHSQYELWPLQRAQSLNRGSLNMMPPPLRRAVLEKCRTLFHSHRAARAINAAFQMKEAA